MLRSQRKKIGIVFRLPNEGMVLGERQLILNRGVQERERFADQPLNQRLDGFVAMDAIAHGHLTGLLHKPAGLAFCQTNDPPQLALSNSSFLAEQGLA